MFKAIFGKRNSQAENQALSSLQPKARDLMQEYLELQERFVVSIGPHMRFGIDMALRSGSAVYPFTKTWDEQLDAMTPVERGQLFVDLMHWRWLMTHESADYALRKPKDPEMHLLCQLHISMPDKISHGAVFKKQDILFSEPQARKIRSLMIDFSKKNIEYRFYYSLGPKLITALCAAFPSCDQELATAIRNAGYGLNWAEPLLRTICPFEAAYISTDEKRTSQEERQIEQALRKLVIKLNRFPGQWITVPIEENQHWPQLNHQLFPFHFEVHCYLDAIVTALKFGRKIEAEKARAIALVQAARANLQALKAGRGTVRPVPEITASFPPGEAVSTRNPYWTISFPSDLEEIADRYGNLKVSLIIAIEASHLRNIEKQLDDIKSISSNTGYLAKLQDVTPSSLGPKPTKTWLKKAADSLDGTDLDEIIRAVDEMKPVSGQDIYADVSRIYEASVELEATERDQHIALWAAHLAGDRAIAPLMKFARKCYAKQPGVGPTNARLGNAASVSLSLIAGGLGVPALMQLEREVKYPQIKRHLEKCIAQVADRTGLTKQAMIEEAVIDHGFS